jgi:hypothetical protein
MVHVPDVTAQLAAKFAVNCCLELICSVTETGLTVNWFTVTLACPVAPPASVAVTVQVVVAAGAVNTPAEVIAPPPPTQDFVHVTATFAVNCWTPEYGTVAVSGETLTVTPAATVAVSGTSISPPAESVMCRFPENDPAVEELNRTVSVQVAPPAKVPPQVVAFSENFVPPAVIELAEMVLVPVPGFVIVKTLSALVEIVTVP